MADMVAKDFNYASVDEETAEKLEYYAKSGKALIRKSQIQFIADMGKLLSEARDLLANNKSGTFIKWATAEFDVSKDTIYRYVNAWDRILSHGATIYLNWSETALYLASSKELPGPVVKKLERLPSTGIIRCCDVKRVIEAHKPKPAPKPDPIEITTGEPEQSYEVEDDPADKPAPASQPAVSQASIMLDALGKQIPPNLRSASELAIQLQAIGREIDRYRQAAKDFAEQPGGEWISVQDVDAAVRTLKGHFQQAQFYCVCPRCEGKGCQRCDNTGWLPEHRKNIL